jgi:hypothetical protein
VLPRGAWKTCGNEKAAVSGVASDPYYIETAKVAENLAALYKPH